MGYIDQLIENYGYAAVFIYASKIVHAICWGECFTLESTIFNNRTNILISLRERCFSDDKTK